MADSDSDLDDFVVVSGKVYEKGYNVHSSINSTRERRVPSVTEPAKHLLAAEDFWSGVDIPNADKIKEHLRLEGRFDKEHLVRLFELAFDAFAAEENVVDVPSPVVVCGDVHGQFYDVLVLLETGGDPKDTSYLFLGDYVDRGDFSIEVCILFCAYKVLYKETFFMLRGNHETRHLTNHFTFKDECKYKYDEEIYLTLMDVFDSLPLAAIMNDQFFCVHGGISPSIKSLDDLYDLDRFMEPPRHGIFADLLWSDPAEDFSRESNSAGFQPNRQRGTSFTYGYTATSNFLEEHSFLSIIRAHECQDDGYRMYEKNDITGFPSVISLFSAPCYAGHDNDAAILCYKNNAITIKKFYHVEHPYYLPMFQNAFQWSLPYVSLKVGEFLLAFLHSVVNENEEKEFLHAEDLREANRAIAHKINVVSHMMTLYKAKIEQKQKEILVTGMLNSETGLPESVKDMPIQKLKEHIKINHTGALDSANEAMPADSLIASNTTSRSRICFKKENVQKKEKKGGSDSLEPKESKDILLPQSSQLGRDRGSRGRIQFKISDKPSSSAINKNPVINQLPETHHHNSNNNNNTNNSIHNDGTSSEPSHATTSTPETTATTTTI